MKNQTLKRLKKMLKPQFKSIFIISVLAILINIGEVTKPYLIKIVIDDYLNVGLWQKGIMSIGIIGSIYIAIVLIGEILNFVITTYYKGTALEAVLKKLEEYLDTASADESDINKI